MRYVMTCAPTRAAPPKAARKKQKPAKYKRLFVVVFAMILVVCLLFFCLVRPTLAGIAQARVRAQGIREINDAIQSLVQQRADGFEMVHVLTTDQGKIAGLQADTARMNQLSTQAIAITQEKINQIKSQAIGIPLGALLGPSGPFAGVGPVIHISIMPAGAVAAEFLTEFTQAGINQVRHVLTLRLTTTVSILLPTGITPVEIVSIVPVSDTILIGEVPNVYLNGAQPIGESNATG